MPTQEPQPVAYVERLALERAILEAYAPQAAEQPAQISKDDGEKAPAKEFLQRQKDLRAGEAGDACED